MHVRRYVGVAFLLFLVSKNCAGQPAENEVRHVVTKELKEPRKPAKGHVFLVSERNPTLLDMKAAVYDVESAPGGVTQITVTSFVTPAGSVWAGPEQDYYIETGSRISGFRLFPSGRLLWCDSAVSTPGDSESKKPVNDDPARIFDASVSGADLFEARFATDQDKFPGRTTSLWFETNIKQWFFLATPRGAQYGTTKITGAQVTEGRLKLDMRSPSDVYEATAWIDIESKKVVDSDMRDAVRK